MNSGMDDPAEQEDDEQSEPAGPAWHLQHRRTHSTPIRWSEQIVPSIPATTSFESLQIPGQTSSTVVRASPPGSPPRMFSLAVEPIFGSSPWPPPSSLSTSASAEQPQTVSPTHLTSSSSPLLPSPPPSPPLTPAAEATQSSVSSSSFSSSLFPASPTFSPLPHPASSLSPSSSSSSTPALQPPPSPPRLLPVSPGQQSANAAVPSSLPLPPSLALTGTPVEAERAREEYHGASVEVYGFVAWICSFAGGFAYLIWAFVPDELLHQWGITYYPAKYWAIAIPTWFTVTFFALIFLYVFLSQYLCTADLDSIEAITDKHARRDVSSGRFLNEVIPQVFDMSLQDVNDHLYN